MAAFLLVLAFCGAALPSWASVDIDGPLAVMLDTRAPLPARENAITAVDKIVRGKERYDREKVIRSVIRSFRADDVISNNASWILVSIGTAAVPALMGALKQPGPVGRRAATALGYFESPAQDQIYPKVLVLLKADDPGIRLNATSELERTGWVFAIRHATATAVEIASALTPALNDSDPRVRLGAMLDLQGLGPYAAASADEIARKMNDADSEMRAHAAKALGAIGPSAAPRVSALLRGSTGTERVLAAIALAHADPGQSEAVPFLVDALNGPYRLFALEALAEMGPHAASAQPEIVKILDDPDPSAQHYAIWAIQQIGSPPESIVARLKAIVKKGDDAPTQNAIVLLGRIGPAAKDAIPEIMEKMHGVPGSVPCNAAEALAKIGPASIPVLQKGAQEKDEYRRAWSSWALAQVSNGEPESIRIIQASLKDPSFEVSFRTFDGLRRAGPRAKPFARQLYQRPMGYPLSGQAGQILAQLSGLRFEDLLDRKSSAELQVSLDSPRKTYGQDDEIKFSLRVRNKTSRSLRILNPSCGISMEHTVEMYILQDPGRPVERYSHVLTGGMMIMPSEDMSTLLGPKSARSFDCVLQTKKASGEKSFTRMSFGYPMMPDRKNPPYRYDGLAPGRYRIFARYHLSKTESERTRFWSRELSQKFGPPWLGEADSNETSFEVR